MILNLRNNNLVDQEAVLLESKTTLPTYTNTQRLDNEERGSKRMKEKLHNK